MGGKPGKLQGEFDRFEGILRLTAFPRLISDLGLHTSLVCSVCLQCTYQVA
jgi:hypothetical protein